MAGMRTGSSAVRLGKAGQLHARVQLRPRLLLLCAAGALAALLLAAPGHCWGWASPAAAAAAATARPAGGRRPGGCGRTARGRCGPAATARAARGPGYTGDWGRSATDDELSQELPTLYVYDHCPFCVRARMIFGFKKMPYKLAFLLNDDVVTPTKLIGKKVLPVLESEGEAIGESLDIVAKIDGDDPVLAPAENREDIKTWQVENKNLIRQLTRPRVAEAVLPEFATKAARETWIRNHQFSDGTSFSDCVDRTPELLQELNAKLPALDAMLHSEKSVNRGGLSYDDITLFPQLRTLTLVKGVEWPEKLAGYIRNMAEMGDVPLLEKMAS